MDDHRITAIIFDLGNVLIDFDHKIAAKKICQFCNKSEQEIFDLFFDSELTTLFEEGKIPPLAFFFKVKEILNLKLGYNEFVSIWNEIFFLTDKNRLVYSLARSLKENYKTALLSNINILHFGYLVKNFPVFDAFHHLITSFEVGFIKPHPMIYKKTLELLEVPAHNVFYTDDRVELIEQAREFGFRSFPFQGVDKLKSDFLSVGVELN